MPSIPTYKPQPLLATGEKVEDGGKTLVITLRQGVKFHNGQEMTAEDVVASLKRWGEFGARGKLLMKNATSLDGDRQIRESPSMLSEPNGAWKNLLAYPEGGPVIYPAAIVSAGRQQADRAEGLYRHRSVQVRRMAAEPLRRARPASTAIQARARPGDGYAGARVANFDTIRFIPVPDVGTRVSGVQAGDYDYAEFISGDLYDTLKSNPAINIHRNGAPLFGLFFMNSKERHPEGQLRAAPRHPDRLQGRAGAARLLRPEGAVGGGRLDLSEGQCLVLRQPASRPTVGDAAKAKQMAKDAGYNGTPIRLLVSTNYQAHFDQATVFTKQLADAGINVQMIVVDWATLAEDARPGGPVGHLRHPSRLRPGSDSHHLHERRPIRAGGTRRREPSSRLTFTGTADPDARLKASGTRSRL